MKYAYYPGCSLESSAREYDLSVRALCFNLGIELTEIPGWTCCGASSGHSTNQQLARALAARNLALAEKNGLDIMVACPACYIRFRTAQHEIKEDPQQRAELINIIGMQYQAKYTTRHLLDIIYNDLDLATIKSNVAKPLGGLKLACYYGCYLVRPPEIVAFDDPENPSSMDMLMATLGAEVKDWSGKVDCCGGSLSLSKREIAGQLVAELTEAARKAGAQAIVTACPLCQANLETRQPAAAGDKLPIFYFTELMGLAMGVIEASSWLKKHLISPFSLLKSYGL